MHTNYTCNIQCLLLRTAPPELTVMNICIFNVFCIFRMNIITTANYFPNYHSLVLFMMEMGCVHCEAGT